jgi:hypothetical protein
MPRSILSTLLLDIQHTNKFMTLAPQAARGAKMVARLVDLAAGSSAHHGFRSMSSLPRFEKEFDGLTAPRVAGGTFAVTLPVSLPLACRA